MREISERIIATFIASCDDSSSDVRDQVIQSLRVFAAKDVSAVVEAICAWMTSHKPSSSPAMQREVLIRALHEILKAHVKVGTLKPPVVESVLKVAHGDMVHGSDLNSSWAKEATELFVHTCDLDPARGMAMLIEAIPTAAGGTTPFFVLRAITDFATGSPLRVVPHLKELLKRLVPLLGSVKQDNPRMLYAQTLTAIALAVINLERFHNQGSGGGGSARKAKKHVDPEADGEEAEAEAAEEEAAEEEEEDEAAKMPLQLTPRTTACSTLRAADFSEVLGTACGHLLQEWARISEARVRGPVLSAITALSATLDEEQRVKQLPQVLQLAVAGVKREKPADLAVIAKGCAAMCDIAYIDGVKAAIVTHADTMLQCCASAIAAIHADKGHQESYSGPTHTALRHFLRWSELVAFASVDAVVSFAGKSFDAKTAAVKEVTFRAAVVHIVGHVVSRRDLTSRLQPFKDHFIATLKVVLAEPDVRVKRALASAIVAMATNSEVPFMSQVGAKDLLRFVVKCAAPGTAVSSATPEGQLRDHCRQSLQVLCSSQEHLDAALTWPGVMEHMSAYAAEPDLLNVFPTVLRCIPPLAERMAQTESFYVDFRVNVNMPPPGALVACLVAHALLLPDPDRRAPENQQVAEQALTAMEYLAPLLDEPFLYQHLEEVPTAVAELWTATVPELRAVAENNRAPASDENPPKVTGVEWEDLLCKLVSRTVSARPEAEWVESIANGALNLIGPILAMPADFDGNADAEEVAYTCCRRDDLFRAALAVAGAALARSPRRDLVSTALDTAIDAADPDRAAHRAGVARMLSAIATNKEYVDVVMDKLAILSRPPPEKKGFFASLVSKKESDARSARKVTDRSRAMCALGLCLCARKMPQAALASRLEASIAPMLQTTLGDSPNVEVKQHIIRSMRHLATPLTKLAGQADAPQFKGRDGLVTTLLDVAAALLAAPKDAALHLSTAAMSLEVVRTLIDCLPNHPVPAAIIDRFAQILATTFIECGAIDLDGKCAASAQLLGECLKLQASLLEAAWRDQRTSKVDEAVEPFAAATASGDAGRRIRSLGLIVGTLRNFLERANTAIEEGNAAAPFGATVGRLVTIAIPRIFDPLVNVRRIALDVVSSAVRILAFERPQNFGYEEGDVASAMAAAEDVVAKIKAIKPRVLGVDLTPAANRILVNKELASLNKALCAILVEVLPTADDFCPMLDGLLATAVKDACADGVSTATVVLHGTIRGMGSLLSAAQAKDYVTRVVASAQHLLDAGCADDGVLSSLYVSVRNLVKHHQDACFEALVKRHEPPHGPQVIRAVQAVAADGALQQAFVNFCLDAMLNWPLTDETGALSTAALSAACCVGWCGDVPKCEELLLSMRATIVCVQSLYGSCVFEKSPQHAQYIGAATKAVVTAVSSDVTKDRLERYGWGAFTAAGNQWFDAYNAIVCEVLKYWNDEDNMGEELSADNDRELPFEAGPHGHGLLLPPSEPSQTVVDVAEFIVPYAEKPNITFRRVAVAFIARVLVRHSLGDSNLLQALVTALLGRTGADEVPGLRVEALAAFGKDGLLVHDGADDTVLHHFLPPVTTALLNNLDDDRQHEISLVATNVLRDVLQTSNKDHVQRGASVNIMLKIKGRFEHGDPRTRAAVVALFETVLRLANAGEIDKAHPLQQAQQYVVVMLAHAQEDDRNVRVAARRAVSQSLRLMVAGGGQAERDAVNVWLDRPVFGADGEEPTAEPALIDDVTMNEFGKLWVVHFPGRVSDLFSTCIGFFEAPQPALRLAAAVVGSVVLKHLPPAEFGRTNAEQICASLAQLSRSGSASTQLKARALKALGAIPVI